MAFVIYLILLTWIILWKLQLPYAGGGALGEVNLVPYIGTRGHGGSAPLEVAFNVILFVPFGVFLSLLTRSWQWWKYLVVLVGVSFAFEATQYVLAIGRSDITDVINNTLGGMLGVGLLALARRGATERADAVTGRVLVVGAGILLLAVALFVLSPLQFHESRS